MDAALNKRSFACGLSCNNSYTYFITFSREITSRLLPSFDRVQHPSYHLFWQTISRWFVSFSTSPKFACFMSLSGRKRQIKVYEKRVIVRVMAWQFAINRIYRKSVTPFEWSLGGVKKLYNQWKQKRQNFFSKNFIFPVNSFFVIFISEKQWQRRIETGKNWPTFSSF